MKLYRKLRKTGSNRGLAFQMAYEQKAGMMTSL